MTKRLDYPSKNKAHWGMIRQIPYLIFGKVWSYWIEFGCWQGRWRLVEKIVCPIYWQQSLWVSKEIGSVSLGTGGMLLWLTASVCSCYNWATIKPKGTTRESKVLWNERYYKKLNIKIIIKNKRSPYWSDSGQQQQRAHLFLFFLRNRRTSRYIFAFQI